MNDRSAIDDTGPQPAPAANLENPAAGYAGKPRDTQLEYKAILANASIGIAFTRDRKFTLCNPKFAEMFGWKADELIGQPGEVVYASRESYEAMGAIAVPLLSSSRQLDVEWEVRRKDGSTFLARMIAKAVSPTDTQKGTVWIVEDVTGRKRHADEVARLLREQEAILDTASIGICFVRDRKIVRCNRRMEEMYGFGAGELNGKPTSVTYAGEGDYSLVNESYAEMARGQTHAHVMQARRRDGSLFWERATGRAVDPGDPARGSVWLLEDITEQKRAEEDMHALLAEQQALANNVVVGITFVRDRKTLRCNRRYEELFGFAPGECIGQSTRACYFTDDDFASLGGSYAEIDAGHTSATEHWLRRKDGSGFWCRMSGRALDAGRPEKGYVWLFEDITERKRADREIRRLLDEQALILDNATVGIAFVKNHVLQRGNRRMAEMLGYETGEFVNMPSVNLHLDAGHFHETTQRIYAQTPPGGTYVSEAEFRRKDGSTFFGRSVGRRVDGGEDEQSWIWILEDVTIERASRIALERALAEQELILANATVGIAFARQRVIQRCNPAFEAMFGYEPGELLGKSTALLFRSQEEYEAAGGRMYSSLASGEAYVAERELKRKDGSMFWCKVVAKTSDPSHPEEGAIVIYDDITAERAQRATLHAERDAAEASRHAAEQSREAAEASREALERAVAERTAELQAANKRLQAEISDRKQAESRAQHLADHDALTGLPNRRLLEDRLTQALAASQRNRKQTAVMFVDLDRFKSINDSLGHAAGDILLKEIADRLIKQLRVVDTICRIGGDEFVVVLPEIRRSSDAANVAKKILETVAAPVMIEDREMQITPSVGISVFPDDGRDAETLIRNADAAMYHAKETGRANYQFFTEQMNQAASRRLTLENDLRQAVLKGEMRMFYQPVVDPASGKAVAHEALLRWQHPSRGVIEPVEFVQLAEDTGLILRLGEWVLVEACRWVRFIGGAERGLPVVVNLSGRQFNDPRLLDLVARVLKDAELPAQLLELEIPEAAVMQHPDFSLATLRKLKELGVRLALDDFGIGLSGVAHLRRFPLDALKIDRSLVADVHKDADHNAVIAAIVGLGHALGLKVIAKGVETEAQKKLLLDCGCDLLQGFLTGRPADADTAAKDYV